MSRRRSESLPPGQRERHPTWRDIQHSLSNALRVNKTVPYGPALVIAWTGERFIRIGRSLIYFDCRCPPQLPTSSESSATYPEPVPTADQTLTSMRVWKANWNGRDCDAPRSGAISNALASIRTFRNVAKIMKLPWVEPHVTASLDGEPVFEWWYGHKKLTLYFQETTAEYVKVWGPNVHHEMEDGVLGDFEPLLSWLTT